MNTLNLPNLLTLGRLLSVPVTVWLISDGRMLAAFWLFVAAGVSDALDGLLARLFNARTLLGTYLDPLADKALLVSIYVALGWQGELESWLVIMVVFRDVFIIGGVLLMYVVTDRAADRPIFISKVNTAMQLVLASVVLAHLGFGLGLSLVIALLTYLVALTTLASGIAYLAVWWSRIAQSAKVGDRP